MPETKIPRIPRRAIARGLAWAAPAAIVTTAAPSYAASCNTAARYTAPLHANSVTRTSGTQASGVATSAEPGSTPVTYSVQARAGTGTSINTGSNLTTAGGTASSFYNGLGDLRVDGLQLQQNGSPAGQVVTFTFSRPITDLSFTVADLDSMSSGYKDAVTISPTPTAVVNNGAAQGNGTAASPLQAINQSAQVNSDVVANRSSVKLAGPLTTFTLTFSSTRGTTAQQIFLRDLVFTADAC